MPWLWVSREQLHLCYREAILSGDWTSSSTYGSWSRCDLTDILIVLLQIVCQVPTAWRLSHKHLLREPVCIMFYEFSRANND